MRKEKIRRIIAFYLLINLVGEICFPTTAMALTSGPAQPETSSFEPVGTSEMVDLFSGDFTYNIPLLEVEGYPVNISYNSNITTDQEASWVGLGWNINAGSITRNMRGIPDDFNGDEIKKEINMKPNRTYGISVGRGREIAGFEFKGLKATKNVSFGINYNNYTGISFELAMTMGLAAAKGSKTPYTASLGFSSGANGLTISPRVGYSSRLSKAEDLKGEASIGTSFNSRAGLKALTLSASIKEGTKTNSKGQEAEGSSLDYSLPISFGRSTYIPQVRTPMKSVAVTLSFKYGNQAKIADRNYKFGGFFSQEKLAENESSKKSYGYLNLQNASNRIEAMLDFNREKDGPFGDHTSTLPMAGLTYDMYNVSAQGIGGMFRPYRNDLGYVYDHEGNSKSDSYSLGVELEAGSIVKLGIDVAVTDVRSNSGQWNDDNTAKQNLRYRGVNEVPGFEPAFFKQAGELNVDVNPDLYASIRNEELVRLKLNRHSKFKHEVKAELETDDNHVAPTQLATTNYKTQRPSRNQNFSYISRAEYAKAAMSKYLAQKPVNDPNGLYDISGGTCNSLGHHIGEITTVKTDGTRYVYGIASYNTKHREVSFNASTDVGPPNYNNTSYVPNTGLVSYLAGADNSKENKRGLDNFFSATEIPPYAHSYLLTSVYSSDYIDVTGDGPTNDDMGTYTKFTYKRTTNNSALGTTGNYKWRVPFEASMANYNENTKALPYDDQGNYLYGEKEIRFLEKIETKNYVAVFETAPRKDGFGVAGENGGISTGVNPMHLLKKISLYARPDYVLNPATAAPIKVVNFIYDYTQCLGIPNRKTGISTPESAYTLSNTGGKLTLKQIYFTYGKSLKGKLSPYKFEYGDPNIFGVVINPPYNIKNYDRWGVSKRSANPGGYQTGVFGNGYPKPGTRTNSDYPYTCQSRNPSNYGADTDAWAWQLTRIDLPSGGKINVEYEADDYAYVQDKKAMQMFSLTNIGTSSTSHPDPGYNNSNIAVINDLSDQRNVLFFKLKNPILKSMGLAAAENIFRRDYLKDIEQLYFRANMRVSNATNAYEPEKYDDVSGYAQIFSSGLSQVVNNSSPYTATVYQYGYIQLKNVCKGDRKDGSNCVLANPISKATWQYARLHCQREALNANNDPDPNLDPEDIILGLVDVVANVGKTFMGVNSVLNASGIGKDIAFTRSWIRLNSPDAFKIGGGSRVKKLSVIDNWDVMTGSSQTPSSYGQTYEYTTIDEETGNTISSGVAQNEPSIGNDENPLKRPIAARNININTNILAPDDYQYLEYPIGESFYPGCSVGYSKVTVKNLVNMLVKRHATGKVVYSYYTAKDFPVIAEQTELDAKRGKSVLGKLLKFNVKDYMTASQGFRVILNDMHGKLRSQFVYGEDKPEAISGTEYIYKTDGGNLLNTVTVINKDGSTGQKNVGVDYDFVADFREDETETITAGLQVNLYLFNIGPVPGALPPVIPQFNREHVRFRSASVSKVINKYGLLDTTIVYDLGSKATTAYLAYDAITGEVLLTKTNTSFDDATYNLKYPAHFAYEGMGPAFKNTGILIKGVNALVNNTNGKLLSTHPYFQFLSPGDVLMCYNSGALQTAQYWVHKLGNDLYIVNATGAAVGGFTANDDFRVYRSGRRNMQTMSVGAVTSFYNPLDGNKDNAVDPTMPLLDESFGVIQSAAVEFSDKWQTFCECGITPGSQYNPYLIGRLGNWRKKKEFAFLGVREQTKLNGNSNVRKDGVLKNYSPFWTANSGSDWNVPNDLYTPNPKWSWVSESVKYSTNGLAIEDKDALGRYSAAYLGYNYTLASAVVANSKYRQSGFDSFEDYAFRACTDDHLGFKQHKAQVVTSQSHTGKRSIKLTPSSSVLVTKSLDVCP